MPGKISDAEHETGMRNRRIRQGHPNSNGSSCEFSASNRHVFRPGGSSVLVFCLFVFGCASTPHHHHAPVVGNGITEQGESGARTEAAPQQPNVYIIKKGDTFYSIALNHGINQKDLAEWNNIQDPTAIHIGQQLNLSSPSQMAQPALFPIHEPVQPSAAVISPDAARRLEATHVPNTDKLKTEPKAFKITYSEQAVAQLKKGLMEIPPPVTLVKMDPAPEKNNEINTVPAPAEAAPDADRVEWIWPTKGKVSELFSESTKGIDIAGKQGQEVTASAGGKVVYSGAGLRGYGKLVIIKHNNTYLSAYAHNNKILVKEGQTVIKGQKIAEMGSTDSSLVKLHFEIRKNGKPVDPLKHLPGISG